MNQSHPIENLFQALNILRDNAPQVVSCWFEKGINSYLNGDDMETAFMLNSCGVGQEKILTKWKRQQRNRRLMEAYKHVKGLNSWQRAEELRKQIRNYQTTSWRFDIKREEPPLKYSELRKQLFYALKSGSPIPSSTRQIWEIVTTNEI